MVVETVEVAVKVELEVKVTAQALASAPSPTAGIVEAKVAQIIMIVHTKVMMTIPKVTTKITAFNTNSTTFKKSECCRT